MPCVGDECSILFKNDGTIAAHGLNVEGQCDIPALDGGHVIFLLYEMISGRPPSDQFLTRAQVVGMTILFTLLIYANGMDIFRWITE